MRHLAAQCFPSHAAYAFPSLFWLQFVLRRISSPPFPGESFEREPDSTHLLRIPLLVTIYYT